MILLARIAPSLAVNAAHIVVMTAPSVALAQDRTTSSPFGAAPQQSKHRRPDVVPESSAMAGRATQQTTNSAATGEAEELHPDWPHPAPTSRYSGTPSPERFDAVLPPSVPAF